MDMKKIFPGLAQTDPEFAQIFTSFAFGEVLDTTEPMDEPTRYLHNTGVTRTKQNHYTPPVSRRSSSAEYSKLMLGSLRNASRSASISSAVE